MGRFLSVCLLIVGMFLIWFSQYSDTSKLVRDIKNAEKVTFEKEQPEFEKDLKEF